ncbi:MAG: hypothetical protein NVSMB13_11160 [Mycobacteriales bacterium]
MAQTDVRTTNAPRAAEQPAAPAAGQSAAMRLLRGLVRLYVVAVVVQFYLAGRGVFAASGAVAEASSLEPHRLLGALLGLLSALVLVAAAFARPGRRLLLGALALFVLTVGQGFLAQFGSASPWLLGALHPVNGLLIVGVAVGLATGTRSTAR